MADAPEAEKDPNTLVLEPFAYEKLGAVHCAVTREGLIAVCGTQYLIEDGAKMTDETSGISVQRKGEEYTFTRKA